MRVDDTASTVSELLNEEVRVHGIVNIMAIKQRPYNTWG